MEYAPAAVVGAVAAVVVAGTAVASPAAVAGAAMGVACKAFFPFDVFSPHSIYSYYSTKSKEQ